MLCRVIFIYNLILKKQGVLLLELLFNNQDKNMNDIEILMATYFIVSRNCKSL